MYFILKCSRFATKLYYNKINIIFLIINRSIITTMNNNEKQKNTSSYISISSTKTKGSYQMKRKRTKNKRSSKRKHTFCIIV